MNDQRAGQVLRLLRQRKGWRQQDLGTRAGVSASLIARIERGALATIPLGKVRRVAETLGARFDTIVRWQGADLGRLLDARHAAMHEAMARFLGGLDGWQFEPEVSFSIYGERGIIDILAWHPGRRMLLVIELKTEVVEVSGLLGTMDQRRSSCPRDRRSLRLAGGGRQHVAGRRRQPNEPSLRLRTRECPAREDASRRPAHRPLATGSVYPHRCAQFPAKSAPRDRWATFGARQTGQGASDWAWLSVRVIATERPDPGSGHEARRSVS